MTGRPITGRIVIDYVGPRTTTGLYPPKALVARPVNISVDIFADGHDELGARLLWRPVGGRRWSEEPMAMVEAGLDRWEATLTPVAMGAHQMVVEAWRVPRHPLPPPAATPPHGAPDGNGGGDEAVGADEAEDVKVDVTRSEKFGLWVDRGLAGFGAWYEFFPRSEGGFTGATPRLRAIAAMGFDVVYLPPIHPIGRTARKGPNNSLDAGPDDPGSPWAIGNESGGHTAIEASLGDFDDFAAFVAEAGRLGMEVALDYALQCSPDHPWVTEHPDWFHRLADGSIRPAENPPKRYEDIFPLNFWPHPDAERRNMWDACHDIIEFWIDRGVKVFRVDNPHTKPIAFWAWLIDMVRREHPEVIFLAEAFTRPKVMAKLAEVGFTQSYTYFTWRTTSAELREYLEEVCLGPKADFMRPNFWPNTPDILSGPLRDGPPAAFKARLVLAATAVGSYGIYSGYELLENKPFSDTNEEYLDSEKYQIRNRDWSDPASLAEYITRLNDIRRRHPAVAAVDSLRFHPSSDSAILAYSKHVLPGPSAEGDAGVGADGDVVLVVVNLDPYVVREAVLTIDLAALGLAVDGPIEAHDELSGATWRWTGPNPYVRLDPLVEPAHVVSLRPGGG